MPQRLTPLSPDGSELTIEALRQIAPSCITEVKDPQSGAIRQVVDFDVLRTLLGDQSVEAGTEMYSFIWPGKQAARREAATPITDTLRPVLEDSVDWDSTENLYIEGDNLSVLKLLQRSYVGKIKMIYIDPPYNTGNDFIYNDDYTIDRDTWARQSGERDEEGNQYRKNPDTNGRFHSDWCSMIYSRLLLSRSLLTDDGVIFISIDDNEVHNLRKICDEVFGASNFVAQYKWNKTATPPSLSYKVRTKYEYILCYEKSLNNIKYNGGVVVGGDMPLLNDGNPVAQLVFPKDSIRFNFDGSFSPGVYGRVSLKQPIEVNDGKPNTDVVLEGPFKWTQETLSNEIKNRTSFIVKSKKFAVRYSRVGERIKRPSDVISKPECGVGTNEDASKDVAELFGSNVMSYPKPVSLIKYLIPFAETDKDSIVLDFFSGSGTTAHAVMQLNAEDGGHRKFICVQFDEDTPEGSVARNAGYKTIPDIAKERIRRAATKIKEENPLATNSLDTGFRVFRLDSSNFTDVKRTPASYEQTELDQYQTNIKTDRSGQDLLYGAMLSWGVPLSLPQAVTVVDGCEIYNVDEGALVACFDKAIPTTVIEAIADMDPLRVLLSDSSFASDKEKINTFELLKQRLNWDDREALDKVRVL